jgi:hypothetical protein
MARTRRILVARYHITGSCDNGHLELSVVIRWMSGIRIDLAQHQRVRQLYFSGA